MRAKFRPNTAIVTRMVDVTLRTARADDVPQVLALWLVAAENSSRPTDTGQAVETLIARDAEALVVADFDGVIVGTIIAGWDGWRAHLYRLAVHPDYRRQGMAMALLARAEQRLAALGATRLDAMVLDENSLGQSIWQRCGYRRQPDWSRWVKAL
jgi:ribosomal protein S18 acetylase RimI-like enzyme